MSVEQLLDKAISPELIQREQGRVKERHIPRSPVHIIANVYISEAQETIQEVSKQLDEAHKEIASQKDFLDSLNPNQRRTVRINCAGLMMGVSLHAIEDVLVERKFSDSNLVAEYNMAVAGTYLDIATYNEGGMGQITQGQWRNMLGYIKKDPTFGILFTEGFKALPINIQNILQITGVLPIIREDLLPIYRDQTTALIANSLKE